MDTEHVEPIRGCFEDWHLEGVANSSHGGGESIFPGELVENGLAIAEMHKARRGNRKIDRLVLEMAEDMNGA